MKISATLFLASASVGVVSAFVKAPGDVAKSSARLLPLHMANRKRKNNVAEKEVTLTMNQSKTIIGSPEPKRKAPQMSQALPFMNCPSTLDGSMAADVGFDPFGFADSYENLANYREAEVKHARLAMLAAAGWPLSELWDAKIANVFGMEPVLDASGRVPSVLNGGMGKISVTYWIGIVVLAAALDVYGAFFASKKEGYFPGDLGFDPLGFYPKEEKGRRRMQMAEIKNGRLAMLAISAFAAQEFISHVAVVDQSAFFFRPINEVLMGQVPGYYIPPEALTEAASVVVPEIAVPAVVEATAAAPDVVAPVAVEAASSFAPPTAAIESLSTTSIEATSAAPVETATATSMPSPVAATEELDAAKTRIAELQAKIANKEELVTAKNRIVDLEAKLAQIESLVR